MNLSLATPALVASALLGLATPALADDFEGPPFDFSDTFYLANGINPSAIIGRPTGTGPNSVIDNRNNGPDFNNVRLLDTAAAYDHSGHPIFFVVTGLPTDATFTNNSAGREARRIAEQYKTYEFPRMANAPGAVFPKAQELIADLRNGYFSNNPLGLWQINIVRFTPAAFDTAAGRAAMADLAARNGVNLDNNPLIRTVGEVEDLRSRGLVTIDIPPANTPGVFRWFFCPVLEDPRDGVIAPDAHLSVTGGGPNPTPFAREFINLFNCLQTTGRECDSGGGGGSGRRSDCDRDGRLSVSDIFLFVNWYFAASPSADFDSSGQLDTTDIFQFLNAWFGAL